MEHFFTIIGGMGTSATETYLHQLNERTPATNDQEYLNYILVNHATVPDRTDYILDHSKPSPLPPLLTDFKQQAALKPDFFTLPCNTAHYFYDELTKATDIPILHMPREAVKWIGQNLPNAKKVGLISTEGTRADHIYDDEIKNAGYELVLPDDKIQQQTNELIYANVKEKNSVDRALYHEILRQMFEEKDCDTVVLGCTELSLAQDREPYTKHPVTDSQSILVDKTIELAKKYAQE
ncbi:amino acid racemase [Ligilactobacillus pobuzihii]|uniref:aspartate/glutamate racemase family protein n=1 Tax=Ligilactobacillus pobuzihii TaxID=449659 RepID=UPI0019D0325A|nr:amino acid racemase [Ligilactobacillus pobuzihii]MBN7274866.1 amino acid racemase [Ligilactobacillus pobuzihii]HIZ95866.1 amino acid racemase [Candidatus Ligilactobacillus excrementavium]